MIVWLSNFINHHQAPVARELFRLTDGQYRFIEMNPIRQSFLSSGYPEFNDTPWLIKAWENIESHKKAERLFIDADVAVYGGYYPYKWIKQRLDTGKITFEYGERWMKRGIWNLLSPRLMKHQWHYHVHFSGKSLYRLNAGAYAADDMRFLHSFRGKQFKWGYFTDVQEKNLAELHSLRGSDVIRIMWCARFIRLKHPEMAVVVASRLKDAGIRFSLDMYGTGPEESKIKERVIHEHLEEYVNFHGNLPNAELMRKMDEADIFLFTSDRREGWGAVINEAMSRGCAVISSDAPGCAKWLISDQNTGIVFKSGNTDDLISKILLLVRDKERIRRIGTDAYRKMLEEFSPQRVAARFIKLATDIRYNSGKTVFTEGICSPDIDSNT